MQNLRMQTAWHSSILTKLFLFPPQPPYVYTSALATA